MTASLTADPYVTIAGPDVESTVASALSDSVGPDSAGEYTASCPAHPDQIRSLRWRVSGDGRALLHCHAGCTFEEIALALDLEQWQLRPVRVLYDYFGPGGDYRFTVIREYSVVEGDKETKPQRKVRQAVRQPDGSWVDSLSEVDMQERQILFRADELAAAPYGDPQTLWLPEGEKDAALLAQWLREQDHIGSYASSLPGGAGRKPEQLTWLPDTIANLGFTAVKILCDRDKSGAGEKRGRMLARLLNEAQPDIAVQILIPTEGAGKDAGELIDKFGRNWLGSLEEFTFDPVSDALVEYHATAVSGQMVVVNSAVGRPVLAMVRPGQEDLPMQALTGVIEPLAVSVATNGVGRTYTVSVRPQQAAAPEYQTTISSSDLVSGNDLAKWLSRQPEFGRAVSGGCRIADVAEGLRLFLDYRVRVAGRPVAIAPAALGWVDATDGRVADVVPDGSPLVFVDRAGAVVAASRDLPADAAGAFAPADVSGGRTGEYGFAGTEVDAAWAVWQTLTFAPVHVTAPVLGFAAATVLSPFFAAAGAGLRPGLTMVAPSGSGKTHGAAGLLLGQFGCPGHQAGSQAAMRRKLEGGVGTMVWFDDTSVVEDEKMKEWLRVAITRSEFALSDVDSGLSATRTGRLTSVPVISAEGVRWMAETAMRDRFISVRPVNPQGRTSWRAEREGKSQWQDVVAVERDLLRGDPASVAGWTVAGCVRVLRELDPNGRGDAAYGAAELLREVGEFDGWRGSTALSVASVGLAAALRWLEGVRDASRATPDGWPGDAVQAPSSDWDPDEQEAPEVPADWARDLQWVRTAYARWSAGAVESDRAAACSLIDEVIPRLVQAHLNGTLIDGNSQWMVTDVDARDSKVLVSSLKARTGLGRDSNDVTASRGLPAILADLDGYLWIRTSTCAQEYAKLERRAESRTTGEYALASQSQLVCDDPPWATFIKNAEVSRGVRVRVQGAGSATYRRLSQQATRRALSKAQG